MVVVVVLVVVDGMTSRPRALSRPETTWCGCMGVWVCGCVGVGVRARVYVRGWVSRWVGGWMDGVPDTPVPPVAMITGVIVGMPGQVAGANSSMYCS